MSPPWSDWAKRRKGGRSLREAEGGPDELRIAGKEYWLGGCGQASSMRIGIETSVLQVNRTGTAVYTRQLVTHLLKLRSDHQFFFYAFGKEGAGTFRRRLERFTRDTAWMQMALPLKIWRDQVDVFHATGFSAPLAI